MDELVDIVNNQDRVIGQAKMAEAHQKQLLHRYSHVIIVRSDDRLVIQKRHPEMKSYPGTFDASVGEHVSAGESYLQAAMRGLPEEIGIKTEIEFIARIENRINPRVENMLGELFVGYHDGPYEPQESEIETLELLTLKELNSILENSPNLICDNFKPAIKAYREYTMRLG